MMSTCKSTRMSLSNKVLIKYFSLHIRGCGIFGEIKNCLPLLRYSSYVSIHSKDNPNLFNMGGFEVCILITTIPCSITTIQQFCINT